MCVCVCVCVCVLEVTEEQNHDTFVALSQILQEEIRQQLAGDQNNPLDPLNPDDFIVKVSPSVSY